MGLRRSTSGMVLMTVVMVVMVLSVFLTVIISQSLSQTTSSQAKVDEIKAYQLAQGAFWKYVADRNNSISNPTLVGAETLNGKTFTPSFSGTGDYPDNPLVFRVNYPN